MSFGRKPVLDIETEKTLKSDLQRLWREKKKASEIARILGFGLEGSEYQNLKPYHVYYYRKKFGLLKRRESPIKKGTSRYKTKQTEVMPFNVFEKLLNDGLSKRTFFQRRMRSYLILHYWTPLRKSEIYERTADDFEIKNSFLIIHLLRKKKRYNPSIKDEPLSVPLALPLMDEVVDWLKNKEWFNPITNPKNRPWNISNVTAWNYVKRVFPLHYPHFFRFNWITDALNDPETTITELRSKTGLHIITINNYIMSSIRFQTSIDQRKLEKLKEVLSQLKTSNPS